MVEPADSNNQPSLPVTVLAIDGGGVRGIIPSHVLVALEEITGRSVASMFNVIIGTSIGGIGALALSAPNGEGKPDLTARDVLDFFRNRAGQIFPRTSLSWPRSLRELEKLIRLPTPTQALLGSNREIGNARYSAEGLESALVELLGERNLSDALTDVVIPTYDVRAQRPWFYRSEDVRNGQQSDLPMWKIGMATAAAPTYFPPVLGESDGGDQQVLVDGGIFANSPAMVGLLEGVVRARALGGTTKDVVIVSVGTGRVGPRPDRTYDEYAGLSWFKLAQAVYEAAQAGQSSLNDELLVPLLGDSYWRFDTVLPPGSDLGTDNSEDENLDRLSRMGLALVGERIADLTRLAQQLTSN
jgi:patatin-like phospholipase/acyl hydrolase